MQTTISNEGNDFNSPLTAVFYDEDEWEETERINTPSITIPSGSTGTKFTFTFAMEKAVQGHNYSLSLYNPQLGESLLPSYRNEVTFVAGAPIATGVAQPVADDMVSFDGSQISCQALHISLYNIVGQLVASVNGSTLSTAGLPQGNYILRAKTAQGIVTKKIIIR